jgi:hypothetical protein
MQPAAGEADLWQRVTQPSSALPDGGCCHCYLTAPDCVLFIDHYVSIKSFSPVEDYILSDSVLRGKIFHIETREVIFTGP